MRGNKITIRKNELLTNVCVSWLVGWDEAAAAAAVGRVNGDDYCVDASECHIAMLHYYCCAA
jgi:hypothetical protein